MPPFPSSEKSEKLRSALPGRGRFITWTDESGQPVLRIERLGYAAIAAWAALVLASFLWFEAGGNGARSTEEDEGPATASNGEHPGSSGPGETPTAAENGDGASRDGAREDGSHPGTPGGNGDVMSSGLDSSPLVPSDPPPIEGSENERIRAIREIVKRAGYPDWRTLAPKLVATLERDPSLNVRLTAIRALTLAAPGLGGPAAVRRLQNSSLEELEAEALLGLLANSGADGGIRVTLAYAHHEKSRLRAQAIQGLYSILGAGAVPELSRAAWSDPDRAVRQLAVRLLKGLDDADARQTLLELGQATDDPDLKRLIRE